MSVKRGLAVLVASLVVTGAAVSTPAQDAAQPKGVTAKNLVTSLGGFRATANVPIVMTGQMIELEPGGQTGRERFLVPAYIYVLEGTLTTNTEGGPAGLGGFQYHTAGQSHADPGGLWHNYMNTGQSPVKYLQVLIATPGGATMQKAADD
jgi:quercetin dioxygenase-like cupin family protein